MFNKAASKKDSFDIILLNDVRYHLNVKDYICQVGIKVAIGLTFTLQNNIGNGNP